MSDSSEDGEEDESNGDEENARVSIYLSKRYKGLISMAGTVIWIDSNVSRASARLLTNSAQELKTEVYGLEQQIDLINQFRIDLDDQMDVVEFGVGPIDLDEENKSTISPRVDLKVHSQMTAISEGLGMSKSKAGRLVISKAISEKLRDENHDNVPYRDVRDCIRLWESSKRQIDRVTRRFDAFVKVYFVEDPEYTIRLMREYPGAARDWCDYYLNGFKGTKGYKSAVDRLGQKEMDSVDETIREVIQDIPLDHEWD